MCYKSREKGRFICKITTGELIVFQQCGIWFCLTRWTCEKVENLMIQSLLSVFIWWKILKVTNNTGVEFNYFLCGVQSWLLGWISVSGNGFEDCNGELLALVTLEKWPMLCSRRQEYFKGATSHFKTTTLYRSIKC